MLTKYISPICAFLALIISIAAYQKSETSEKIIETKVYSALREKEKEYVEALTPGMRDMYAGILKGKFTTPLPKSPTTFAELLTPLAESLGNLKNEN
jgi:hypothetical protein